MTEAHGCEQLIQGCYSTARRPGLELATSESPVDALATRLSSHPITVRQILSGHYIPTGSMVHKTSNELRFFKTYWPGLDLAGGGPGAQLTRGH